MGSSDFSSTGFASAFSVLVSASCAHTTPAVRTAATIINFFMTIPFMVGGPRAIFARSR